MQDATTRRADPALAVSYLRVSTKEQAERDGDPEGYSIPAQREANKKKADGIGARIVAEFIDRGESARSADRPQLRAMLDYVRREPVEYCVVHKVDRLARNRADDVEINLALQASGVRLVSATENIDATPSGMLLHGIMSSIAEFYSRNLANEVLKGMSQKAKTGGTPGKAPIGYRNVGVLNAEGREVRTVVVDKARADLIRWAFEAYATGEWTVRLLAAELAERGLAAAPTPSRPAKAINANQLHKILTNPYYTGVVRFQGAVFEGRHEPLVSAVTWQKVQLVLSTHVVGEKVREYPHYLKSSVYCGTCGSRLLVQRTVNRHGTLYEYFICAGRAAKRNDCDAPAVPIAHVEKLVVALYANVALAPELRDKLGSAMRAEIEAELRESVRQAADLELERARLSDRAKKLLDGHLGGIIPADLYAEEQKAITSKLAAISERLDGLAKDKALVMGNLDAALTLAGDCYEAYLRAPDHLRRSFNQAFFSHIYVDRDGPLRGDMAQPFEIIIERSRQLTTPVGDAPSATDGEPEEPSTTMDWVEGSGQVVLVPLEGLEPPTVSLGRNCSSIELQRLAHPL